MNEVQFDLSPSCTTQTRHSADIFNSSRTMKYNDQLSTPPATGSPEYDCRMDYFHYKPVNNDLGDDVEVSMAEPESMECDHKPKLSVDVKTYCGNQQFISPIELGEYKKFTPNTRALKFLLVDDNFINLKILERVLFKLYPNCAIIKTQDSMKIMELVHVQHFDAVFLDIEMPGLTGIQLAQLMRSDKKFDQVGIIAVTTKNLPTDRLIYQQAGIDHTLAKPLNYTFDHIITCIDEVLLKRVQC